MRRPTAPRLTEHEARAAASRIPWRFDGAWHKAACPCCLCQACRKAFVAGCLYRLPKKKKK